MSAEGSVGGDLLVRGIGELTTNDIAHPGTLGLIEAAALAMRDGRVVWSGPDANLPAGLGDLVQALLKTGCGITVHAKKPFS